MELSEETKKRIAEYEKSVKNGTFKGVPFDEVKKRLGI